MGNEVVTNTISKLKNAFIIVILMRCSIAYVCITVPIEPWIKHYHQMNIVGLVTRWFHSQVVWCLTASSTNIWYLPKHYAYHQLANIPRSYNVTLLLDIRLWIKFKFKFKHVYFTLEIVDKGYKLILKNIIPLCNYTYTSKTCTCLAGWLCRVRQLQNLTKWRVWMTTCISVNMYVCLQGYMEYTVLFYGYYFNKTFVWNEENTTTQHYNMPLAYILTILVYLMLSLMIMVG